MIHLSEVTLLGELDQVLIVSVVDLAGVVRELLVVGFDENAD